MRIASLLCRHSRSGETAFSAGRGISPSSERRGLETLRMKESLKLSLDDFDRCSRGRVSSVQIETMTVSTMKKKEQMIKGVA